MANKLVRGSLIIFAGNIIFRIGGYIYRFLMAMLLGPTMYGVLGLTLPFQGIFQTLAAGGLPPAIAKYVAEYNAVNESDMARQTIFTALKIMVFLGLFFGVLMIFVVAPYLTYNYLGKPIALVSSYDQSNKITPKLKGSLHTYARPSLIEHEKNAWEKAVCK